MTSTCLCFYWHTMDICQHSLPFFFFINTAVCNESVLIISQLTHNEGEQPALKHQLLISFLNPGLWGYLCNKCILWRWNWKYMCAYTHMYVYSFYREKEMQNVIGSSWQIHENYQMNHLKDWGPALVTQQSMVWWTCHCAMLSTP